MNGCAISSSRGAAIEELLKHLEPPIEEREEVAAPRIDVPRADAEHLREYLLRVVPTQRVRDVEHRSGSDQVPEALHRVEDRVNA